MKTDFNTIIVGGGPAGLFAACNIENGSVLLLEGNDRCGKKLLISGAGQCNFTHSGDIDEFLKMYGDNGKFLKPALYSFGNQKTIEFFRQRGVDSFENENGKIFPKSLKAIDVLNVLLEDMRQKGVKVKYNSRVKVINYNDELKIFTVKTDSDRFTCQNVIIATGGKSVPLTGSRGDGYVLGENLGHKISDVSASLTPVNVKDYKFSDLSGISFQNVNISLWRDNKKLRECNGDILFTHKNLSGPGILNFSRYIKKSDIIKVNFIKENEAGFGKILENKLKENGKLTVKSVIRKLDIPCRFADKLLEITNIGDSVTCSTLGKNERRMLVRLLTGYPFEVESLGDYNIAMATRGGIALDEINKKTMESKIVKGLFFAGEVMDIDGDTGGYNIQAAFSTGRLAAVNVSYKPEAD